MFDNNNNNNNNNNDNNNNKYYSFGNSSHPQKGSVNQVNFLVPKDHGLAPMLSRLNKQVRDYK